MKQIIIILTLLVAACAQQGNAVWRDMQANAARTDLRSMAALEQDQAQCDYDFALAQNSAPRVYRPLAVGPSQAIANLNSAMLSGPPRNLYYKCMKARGWAFLGYD